MNKNVISYSKGEEVAEEFVNKGSESAEHEVDKSLQDQWRDHFICLVLRLPNNFNRTGTVKAFKSHC